MLRRAIIIDEDDINTDVVSIGATVQVKDLEFDEIVEYMIVGSVEADPYELKISNESPVGKSLIGSRVGEIVEIQIPDGITRYEVLQITR
jgi:transcription elongation factor GreA